MLYARRSSCNAVMVGTPKPCEAHRLRDKDDAAGQYEMYGPPRRTPLRG